VQDSKVFVSKLNVRRVPVITTQWVSSPLSLRSWRAGHRPSENGERSHRSKESRDLRGDDGRSALGCERECARTSPNGRTKHTESSTDSLGNTHLHIEPEEAGTTRVSLAEALAADMFFASRPHAGPHGTFNLRATSLKSFGTVRCLIIIARGRLDRTGSLFSHVLQRRESFACWILRERKPIGRSGSVRASAERVSHIATSLARAPVTACCGRRRSRTEGRATIWPATRRGDFSRTWRTRRGS